MSLESNGIHPKRVAKLKKKLVEEGKWKKWRAKEEKKMKNNRVNIRHINRIMKKIFTS